MSEAAYSPSFKYQLYYRFDERSGKRALYHVMSPDGFYIYRADKYFTNSGKHRKSILVKGKRYYICHS